MILTANEKAMAYFKHCAHLTYFFPSYAICKVSLPFVKKPMPLP